MLRLERQLASYVLYGSSSPVPQIFIDYMNESVCMCVLLYVFRKKPTYLETNFRAAYNEYDNKYIF